MVAWQGDVQLDASLGYLDDSVRANASDLCLLHNTRLVADSLAKAGKDFDLLMLPNARHGFGQDSVYTMRRRWDYLVQPQRAVPPREYQIGRMRMVPSRGFLTPSACMFRGPPSARAKPSASRMMAPPCHGPPFTPAKPGVRYATAVGNRTRHIRLRRGYGVVPPGFPH
ncbi:MAG: hypothetical protein Q8K82_15185 [Gemmatimonadaceae bacterium]|nr:hypothetical protein [Gemmatimonadaceae bacterium]